MPTPYDQQLMRFMNTVSDAAPDDLQEGDQLASARGGARSMQNAHATAVARAQTATANRPRGVSPLQQGIAAANAKFQPSGGVNLDPTAGSDMMNQFGERLGAVVPPSEQTHGTQYIKEDWSKEQMPAAWHPPMVAPKNQPFQMEIQRGQGPEAKNSTYDSATGAETQAPDMLQQAKMKQEQLAQQKEQLAQDREQRTAQHQEQTQHREQDTMRIRALNQQRHDMLSQAGITNPKDFTDPQQKQTWQQNEAEMEAINKRNTPGQEQEQPGQGQPMQIKTAEDFAKLPSGTIFIDPDGHKRKKP